MENNWHLRILKYFIAIVRLDITFTQNSIGLFIQSRMKIESIEEDRGCLGFLHFHLLLLTNMCCHFQYKNLSLFYIIGLKPLVFIHFRGKEIFVIFLNSDSTKVE